MQHKTLITKTHFKSKMQSLASTLDAHDASNGFGSGNYTGSLPHIFGDAHYPGTFTISDFLDDAWNCNFITDAEHDTLTHYWEFHNNENF